MGIEKGARFAEVTPEEERRLTELVARFANLADAVAALGPPTRESVHDGRHVLEYERLSTTANLVLSEDETNAFVPLITPKDLGYACSFCGMRQSEVARLIAGPNAFICNECIYLCIDIISESHVHTELGRSVLRGVQILVQLGDGSARACVRESVWSAFECDGVSWEWCAARGRVADDMPSSAVVVVRKVGENSAHGAVLGAHARVTAQDARELSSRLRSSIRSGYCIDSEPGGSTTMSSPANEETKRPKAAPPFAKKTAAVVRYQVRDVDRSVAFYTQHLGFTITDRPGPVIAIITRGDLHLILGGPGSSGSRPMADGRTQEPGGWNRIVLYVDDIDATIASLRKDSAHFRNDVEVGPGGKQIQIDDPDGNPIELHEAPPEN